MRNLPIFIAAAVGILMAGCSKPADPTGKWTGVVALPAKLANDAQAKAKASNVPLELKKDQSFSMASIYEGTWKLDSDTVSLSITKAMGQTMAAIKAQLVKTMGEAKASELLNGADKPLPMKLASDGKTMTGTLPAGPGQPAMSVTFTKQGS